MMVGMFRRWRARKKAKKQAITYAAEYVYCMKRLAADPSKYKGLARFPGSNDSNDAFEDVMEDISKISNSNDWDWLK